MATGNRQQQHFLEERLAHIEWTLVWGEVNYFDSRDGPVG